MCWPGFPSQHICPRKTPLLSGVMKHAKGRGLREMVHENRARIGFLGGTGKGAEPSGVELSPSQIGGE